MVGCREGCFVGGEEGCEVGAQSSMVPNFRYFVLTVLQHGSKHASDEGFPARFTVVFAFPSTHSCWGTFPPKLLSARLNICNLDIVAIEVGTYPWIKLFARDKYCRFVIKEMDEERLPVSWLKETSKWVSRENAEKSVSPRLPANAL